MKVPIGKDQLVMNLHAQNAALGKRIDELKNALRLPLLFCQGGEWSAPDRALWKHITGHDEATTKVMCDAIRAALAKQEKP